MKLKTLVYYFLLTLFNNKVDNKYSILYNSYKERKADLIMQSRDDIFLTYFDVQTDSNKTKATSLELKDDKVKFTVNAMTTLGPRLKSSILQGKQYYLYCTAISSEQLNFSPSIYLEQLGGRIDQEIIEKDDGVITCLDNQFVMSIDGNLIKEHNVDNVDLLLSIIDVDLGHDTDKQSAALENYFFRTTIPIIK